jgi:pimeloyl-ACP methyl ester carboxylesterase
MAVVKSHGTRELNYVMNVMIYVSLWNTHISILNTNSPVIHVIMKHNKFVYLISASLVLFSTFFSSCKKSENSTTYVHFVSKTQVNSYSKVLITSLLTIASPTIPGVSSLTPLVKSDIIVYRVVYKTSVNGKDINASGLICVPATSGNYPVLSFQNGTNTVNADAPSMSPTNQNYEMVESIASMGYVVVMADYPGFGASSDIPHPYLISEPTVSTLVDLLYTIKETAGSEFPGITLNNDYYLLGYSQGGWATLALHKAIELNYSNDFNLIGSSCGAGPYDILQLLEGVAAEPDYPVPAYLAYIVSAYTSYNQFTNPVTDLFNEPYASRVSTLFTGLLTTAQINSQLTTSVTGLLTSDFISGFNLSPKYSSVRDALTRNSVSAWHTYKPVYFTHGANDTEVNPVSTESIYSAMILAGSSSDLVTKIIIPGVDHAGGVLPCTIQGFLFLNNLNKSK